MGERFEGKGKFGERISMRDNRGGGDGVEKNGTRDRA